MGRRRVARSCAGNVSCCQDRQTAQQQQRKRALLALALALSLALARIDHPRKPALVCNQFHPPLALATVESNCHHLLIHNITLKKVLFYINRFLSSKPTLRCSTEHPSSPVKFHKTTTTCNLLRRLPACCLDLSTSQQNKASRLYCTTICH